MPKKRGWFGDKKRHSEASKKGWLTRKKKLLGVFSSSDTNYYYEIAREIIDSEFSDASSDPKGYTESMGWDIKLSREQWEKVGANLDYTQKDIEKLAEKVKKLIERGHEPYYVRYDDEINDYVTNLVAKRLGEEIEAVKKKRK